jgi:TatD DNase family protein
MIEDIHTHTAGRPHSVLSLAPAEVLKLPAEAAQDYSVSLHPWYVDAEMLCAFDEVAALRGGDVRWRAVGECGLDALCTTPPDVQRAALLRSLDVARATGKPTVLHCVRRWEELTAAVKHVWGPHGAEAAWEAHAPLIIHGFRKGLPLAQSLLAQGFCLSMGERFRPEVARIVPAERLYVETDESALPIAEIRQRVEAARNNHSMG